MWCKNLHNQQYRAVLAGTHRHKLEMTLNHNVGARWHAHKHVGGVECGESSVR